MVYTTTLMSFLCFKMDSQEEMRNLNEINKGKCRKFFFMNE